MEDYAQLFARKPLRLKLDISPEYEFDKPSRLIIWPIASETGGTNAHSEDLMGELYNRATRMEGVELVDREHLDKLIKELKLHKSGFVDEKTIKKFGKFLGSGLILIGRVQQDDYQEDVVTEPPLFPNNNCNTISHRKGTYHLHFNFKLIDIETAQVLFSKTLQSDLSQQTKKVYCETPPGLSEKELYANCIADIGLQFHNLFYRHKREVDIAFQFHNKFKQELNKAITHLSVDEFSKAYGILKNIASAQVLEKAKSRALYNLGLVQYYLGDYDTAMMTAKEGYITDSDNDACRKLWDACKQVVETK